MAPARDDEFLPEVWGLYSIGTLWLVLRFAVRLRTDGIRGLKYDDGLAFMALFAWTYTCIIIEITYHTGTNTDFTAAEVAEFDSKKLDDVVFGSKLFLGSWYAYLVLIFTLKGVVLILYQRIFFQPWQKWVLRITTVLTVFGFVALTMALSLTCLPFRQRWQVSPPPPIMCTASPKILITTSCVNAVTDIFLLSVPISLLWNLNKPLKTRIAVFILLASGLFVTAACIIRVSLTVVPNIFVLNIARWGVREFCVAIIAVNSASLRPMFRRSFWSINKPGPEVQQRHSRYMFNSARRARVRLSRAQRGNQALNSTSAGASTLEDYVQRELGDHESVFEDPDYQMVTSMPYHATEEVTPGDIDLEKGNAAKSTIMRTDSAFPDMAHCENESDHASSGDTRSSQSG